MIPDSVVDEVRLRADIVEVLGEHLSLKKAGKEYKALCPFHQEKTPSFFVVPSKGFYKCFGCGEAGDIFTFLMKRQGLAFPEAVRAVAQRVGVDVPDASREEEREDPNAPLRQALAFAADFYRERLLDPAEGREARAYLERRGITAEAAERYRIGWAPDAWRALREAARKLGIEDDVLLAAGLIKESERGEDPFDRFRERVIFPITDLQGRVIAFGGRVLSAGSSRGPKYLNSPETAVYHKGRNLYGLHWSRTVIRREGEALVVEGYMDYVSLASRGIENVVAPLGTAMTPEQATLLARYTSRALLLYDSDPAGLRATFRSADALLQAGVHPLVVTLPDGEDPDSLVEAGGAAALVPYLRAARDVLDRKIEILEEHALLEDIDGLRTAVDKLLPTLRSVVDPALRDLYVARVAERTGIRRETIEREIEVEEDARVRSPGGERGRADQPRRREPKVPAAERTLLLLLLRDPRLIPAAGRLLGPEDFGDAANREIFEALLEAGPGVDGREAEEAGGHEGREAEEAEGHEGAGRVGVVLSEEALGPGARERLAELTSDPEDLSHGDEMFEQLVGGLRGERKRRRVDELEARMRAARLVGDRELEQEIFDQLRMARGEEPSQWRLGRWRKYLKR